MRTTILLLACTFILATASIMPVFSLNLRGTVLDRKNQPISGAVVTLKQRGLTDTTDLKGCFSFVAASAPKTGSSAIRGSRIINLASGSVVVNNSRHQKVALTLIDLRGIVISRLFDGQLQAGRHHFALPRFSSNQTILIDARIGSLRETMCCIGPFAHKLPSDCGYNSATGTIFASTVNEELFVSHSSYDSDTESVVSLDDSITMRLFHKLDNTKTMTVTPGDTFSCAAKSLSLTLDSISDGRCGCDMLCAWEGNAALYFTVSIDGTAFQVTLGTHEPKKAAVGKYTLSLVKVTPYCPSEQAQPYEVDITLYSTDSSNQTLLIKPNSDD